MDSTCTKHAPSGTYGEWYVISNHHTFLSYYLLSFK
jgi:hypothetical protein